MRELLKSEILNVEGGFYYTPYFWGAVFAAIGYTVSNKYDFYPSGLAVAVLGGGIMGLLEPFGALGKVLQLTNVAITAEIVSYIQTGEL
jgi:hypothetical protein